MKKFFLLLLLGLRCFTYFVEQQQPIVNAAALIECNHGGKNKQ